jgi:SAM-dependent methyltransferase
MNHCRICRNRTGNVSHHCREMMFGLEEKFAYLECGNCGCLQIEEVPPDMSKYYPPGYYSFAGTPYAGKSILAKAKGFLKRHRLAYHYGARDPAGFLARAVFGPGAIPAWLHGLDLNPRSSMLDIGCGEGYVLLNLALEGYMNITGIDPYIQKDIRYENGVTVYKRELGRIEGLYDLIMMHHSFEHMADPGETLRRAASLMHPNSHLLIRTPVVPSLAWQKYGVNWVQLDPPRHLFIHSRKSIEILAAEADLALTNVLYDSTEFQFWGSEQYVNNIPLMDETSYWKNPARSIFTAADIARFKGLAEQCNAEGTGDQACFYLRRK